MPLADCIRWLVGDCGTIIVAGSDTTTSTLACKSMLQLFVDFGKGFCEASVLAVFLHQLFTCLPTYVLTLTDSNLVLFYHLARSPHIMDKLRSELSTFYEPGAESEFKDLQEAAYLNGVINESLRLHPPTPSGLQRLTPDDGLVIGSTFIPGNVTVSTPFWSVGRRKCITSWSRQN
jgi:cytochrome P450